MGIELGDFIRIIPEPEFDFWNNVQPVVNRDKLPVYKVHQIAHNLIKKTYRLALEDISKPGHIDYRTLNEDNFELVPSTRDGSPYTKILKE